MIARIVCLHIHDLGSRERGVNDKQPQSTKKQRSAVKLQNYEHNLARWFGRLAFSDGRSSSRICRKRVRRAECTLWGYGTAWRSSKHGFDIHWPLIVYAVNRIAATANTIINHWLLGKPWMVFDVILIEAYSAYSMTIYWLDGKPLMAASVILHVYQAVIMNWRWLGFPNPLGDFSDNTFFAAWR
jgi:hypothetical protein